MDNASDDLKLYPDDPFNQFTESCETLALNFEENDDIFNHINSQYYNIYKFNNIKPDLSSSIGFSIQTLHHYKHHDDLVITRTQLQFHVIAVTEHKLEISFPFKIYKFLAIMNLSMTHLKQVMGGGGGDWFLCQKFSSLQYYK